MSNPGPKLYKSQFGGEQPIPPKFIAAMERTETKQAVPNEVGPEELSDTVVESMVGTDRTNERVRTTISKKPGSIVLRDIRTNQAGIPVQVVLTLLPTGTPPSVLPGPGISMAMEDLGNGWSIQEVAVEGTYDDNGDFNPRVFSGNVFMREREDLTPPAFRAEAEMVTRETRVAGTAVDPVPLGTDLEKRETQETPYIKRLYRRFRDAVLGTTITHYETDRDKEFVEVTETLKDEADPAPPDAFTDVETTNLGDGRIVETRKTRPEVFPGTQSGRSIPDNVPDEFKVAIPTEVSEVTSEGEVDSPELIPGELEHQETQVQKFVRRVRTVYRTAAALGTSLVSSRTTQEKQVETITRTYQDIADPVAAPSATQRVNVTNLGGERVIEEVASVPSLFVGKSLARELPEVLPPAFRVVAPLITREVSEANQVTDPLPTVGTGELERRETQVDSFVKRVLTRIRITAGVVLTSYRTNERKQLVTVVQEVKPVGAPVGAPTATVDVTTTPLGDGTQLEEKATIPRIFPGQEYAKSIPDLVPEEMRATVPVVETAVDMPGPALNPALGTGELEHREVDKDEFVKRVTSRGRSPSGLPITKVNAEVTTEYGGGVLDVVRTLAVGFQSVVRGIFTVRATVKDLGNGTSLMEHATLVESEQPWPFLTGTEVDAQVGVETQIGEQVVPAGTLGGIDFSVPGQMRSTEVKPLDRWRSQSKLKILYDANILSYKHIFPVILSIQLPRKLEAVIARSYGQGGSGNFESTGTLSTIGTGGTASASADGTAEASAAAAVDLEVVVKEYSSDAVNAEEVLFYGLSGETIGQILVRLATFVGPVSQWPQFTPKEHTLICVGREFSRTFRGQVNKSFATTVNYLGAGTGSGTGFSTGSGTSLRTGVSLKLIRIPPTVHGDVSVTGDPTLEPPATGNGSITMGIDGIVPPTIAFVDVSAHSDVIPRTLLSTGAQVPTSGKYLYRLRGEPYLIKYIKYQATVVNFNSVI